ncbi:MAG: AgmX/PglI C-terminal domain-containing protein [candidate division KSB1 bacterium]|nr:AgmX/PglI C-terminal domain-containing protein [candidate division KSB1 bacterium]MDZ7287400.1 AgmX/PglI C-terminal domain-containing protein [candidate division KSB1 bacterium]MDZ7299514.1 AgmX/PglI C-terminal domain-containing protein [candidate division KSB1 bacterium]MDZ7305441.1 AgmX/PglI C-terminal domain-containing protein [candidate division KSB1 bacterium]MDZ7350378.1 AgmX/PglI C-terminal domain-containing protein [candidate division KSB1 bacterium]
MKPSSLNPACDNNAHDTPPRRRWGPLGLTLGLLLSTGLLLAPADTLQETLQQILEIRRRSRALEREIATLRATNASLKATIAQQAGQIDTLKSVLALAFKTLDSLAAASRLEPTVLPQTAALELRGSIPRNAGAAAGSASRACPAGLMPLAPAATTAPQLRTGVPPALAGLKSRRVGGRDPQAIRTVIQRHVPAITDLYQRELRNNPALYGSLTLRFEVDPLGQLNNSEIINSTLRAPGLEQKILDKMRHWRDFGESRDDAGVARYQLTYVFGDSLQAASFAIYAVE